MYNEMSVMLISVSHDTVVSNKHEERTRHYYVNFQQSASLIWPAFHLNCRYRQLGVARDLEEVIILVREALSLCPQGHPDRSMSLNNLALHLSTQYDQLGALRDLDEAIVLA